MAVVREAEGARGVDLEAEAGVISVLDQQAYALRALLQDLLETGAAVDGGGLGLAAHVRKTSR